MTISDVAGRATVTQGRAQAGSAIWPVSRSSTLLRDYCEQSFSMLTCTLSSVDAAKYRMNQSEIPVYLASGGDPCENLEPDYRAPWGGKGGNHGSGVI